MAKRKKQLQAISYRRVSTEGQGLSGIGLEAQAAAIEIYANASGYTIIADYLDVGSATGEDSADRRPGLQAAIEQAASGRPIIVFSLDRLSRDVATTEDIILSSRITVICADTGAMNNPIIIASRAAHAQRVGKAISENTKRGMKKRKDEGVVFGNPNLPDAQKRGVEARQLQARKRVEVMKTVLQEFPEKLSHQELADVLNQRNIPTASGKPWTAASIRRPRSDAERSIQAEAKAKQDEQEHYTNHPLFGRF